MDMNNLSNTHYLRPKICCTFVALKEPSLRMSFGTGSLSIGREIHISISLAKFVGATE
jgi:hypothetical protein